MYLVTNDRATGKSLLLHTISGKESLQPLYDRLSLERRNYSMKKQFMLKVAQLLNLGKEDRPTLYQYGDVACGQGK